MGDSLASATTAKEVRLKANASAKTNFSIFMVPVKKRGKINSGEK
jgi:hypothetical protein